MTSSKNFCVAVTQHLEREALRNDPDNRCVNALSADLLPKFNHENIIPRFSRMYMNERTNCACHQDSKTKDQIACSEVRKGTGP